MVSTHLSSATSAFMGDRPSLAAVEGMSDLQHYSQLFDQSSFFQQRPMSHILFNVGEVEVVMGSGDKRGNHPLSQVGQPMYRGVEQHVQGMFVAPFHR